jgi:hypothetical protein
MNEDEEGRAATEFLADVIGKMILLGLHSEAGVRYIAYTLQFVVDELIAVEVDSPNREFAEDLVLEILKTLTYVQVINLPSEGDIEQQAKSFREMLDLAENLGNKNNEEDTNNG